MNTTHGATGSRLRIAAARAVILIAAAGAVAGLVMARTDDTAEALPFERVLTSLKVLADQDPVDASEVDFFQTYDLVRDVLQTRDPVGIRVPWVERIEGFDVTENPKLYVDDDTESITFEAHAMQGSLLAGRASFDLLITADWDEDDPTDDDPVLNLAVKTHDVSLQDFSELFGDIGAGVELRLADGWVVFTNTPQQELDLSDLPRSVVDPFYEPLVDDELLAGGEPFLLAPGANFMADLALDQMPSLDRAVSFAGVDSVHLRVHGTLAANAAVLFDEASLDELAVFEVSGTLDSTGANPPAWLTDRAFEVGVRSSDLVNFAIPELTIGDTVTTFIGDAENVFRNGFTFDPAAFDGVGPIPVEARFDLLGDFAEPFGIDVPALLEGALPGELDISLEVAGSVDLSSSNFISSAAVAIGVTDPNALGGPATVRIGLTVDDVLDLAVATFEADLDLSSQELVDALGEAFGGTELDLGPVGDVALDHFAAEVRAVQSSTSIEVSASIGAYPDVLGFPWLDLTDLTVTLELSNDGLGGAILDAPSFNGLISADVEIAGIAWTVEIELDATPAGVDVRVSLLLGDGETLSLQGLVDLLAANDVGGDIDVGSLLGGLQLGDLRVTLRAGDSGAGVDLLAQVVVPGLFDATLYMSLADDGTGTPTFFVGVRPTAPITLASIMAMPGLDTMTLPNLALVMTNGVFDGVPAEDLTPEAFEFLKGVHGCAADKVQPDSPVLPQPLNSCRFVLRLQPGVNLVANVQLPEELQGLADALWIDRTKGIQFVGTITPPLPGLAGFNSSGAVRLLIELPEVNPPETIDFLERGQLSIEAKIDVQNPSLSLKVIGELDTRFRRSNDPATSCQFGELMEGVDVVDDQIVRDDYCYDRLGFEVSAALALSPTSVSLTLEGALVSNSPSGWEAPFGIEWLTIRELRGQLGVQVGLDGFPTFKLGVLGDVEVGGKQLKGSLSIGLKTIAAPPPALVAAVPQFFGVRGFVSSLGSTDLVQLHAAITGGAPLPVEGLPLFEVRNAEFMFALEDNASLCLTTGVGVAGELFFVDDPSTGVPFEPASLPGDCAPFGALVDPERCATSGVEGGRDDGCFASFFAKLDLSGIRVDGSIGPIDLGPLHFDAARLKIILTAEEQIFLIRGGVTIDGIGSGEVAIVVEPTKLQLFGSLEAFGVFIAEVEASIGAGLEAPLTPTFDASLRGALQADFDQALEELVDDALSQFSTTVSQVRSRLDAMRDAEPSDFTDAVVSLLDAVDRGTGGFGFLTQVGDALAEFGEAVDEAEELIENIVDIKVVPPTVRELVDGGAGYVDYGGLVLCGFDHFDSDSGKCRNGDGEVTDPDPDVFCIVPFSVGRIAEDDGNYEGRCRLTIEVDDNEDVSYSGMLQQITERTATGLEQVLTGIDDLGSNLTLDAILDRLENFDAPNVFDLQCANFEFDTADPDPSVAMTLKAAMLGQVFGFDLSLNLTDLDVAGLVDDLMRQLLKDPRNIDCDAHLTPPAGLSSASFVEATIEFADDTITEGDLASLSGTLVGDPGDEPVVIDWGDGSAPTVRDVAANGAFEVAHRYRDDPAGSTQEFTVTLLIRGDVRATTTIAVANARPVASLTLTPATVDEGESVSGVVTWTDPGADTHTLEVDWGDGHTSTVTPARGVRWAPVTHTYLDDDPTATSIDEAVVTVTVTDDDGGFDIESDSVEVRNVAPLLAPDLASTIAGFVITEGAPLGFDVVWTDPGADTHTIEVAWGDGHTSTVTPARGVRSVPVAHTYVDDNPTATSVDPAMITVTVTDDDSGSATLSAVVQVANVPPTLSSLTLSSGSIDELQSVTVTGVFDDPGGEDSHTITVDWGDPLLPDTILQPAVGARVFQATRAYGDNSGGVPFVVTAMVTDDDSGLGLGTATVDVDNVAPGAAIATAGSRVIGGVDTFVVGTGDAVGLSTTATDPGSDDLTVRWDVDAGNPSSVDVVTESLVPGQTVADLLTSANVLSRMGAAAMVDSHSTSYATACRYDLGLSVTDDDGGSVTDSAVVIVVGDETLRRTAGYWTLQYQGKGGGVLPAALRNCYLRIVDHLSATFGEQVPLLATSQATSFRNAATILDGNVARTARQRFDRQLLAVWLDVANGSIGYDLLVDTDGDGVGDRVLSAWLHDLEAGRATASDPVLKGWAAVLERLAK